MQVNILLQGIIIQKLYLRLGIYVYTFKFCICNFKQKHNLSSYGASYLLHKDY